MCCPHGTAWNLIVDKDNMNNNCITIAVGSKNPVKLNAAAKGAENASKNTTISAMGFDVASGVSDQPMTDAETRSGAENRAKAAFDCYKAENNGRVPHYSIGLEGGVALTPQNELECFAWIAAFDGAHFGVARTGAFLLPRRIRDLVVDDGMELGHADDIVFGATNSKQGLGAVGFLTKGAIDRMAYYEHAVVLAFIPFQWPELYT
jgi:inosine/xanthosine triphosphatase